MRQKKIDSFIHIAATISMEVLVRDMKTNTSSLAVQLIWTDMGMTCTSAFAHMSQSLAVELLGTEMINKFAWVCKKWLPEAAMPKIMLLVILY